MRREYINPSKWLFATSLLSACPSSRAPIVVIEFFSSMVVNVGTDTGVSVSLPFITKEIVVVLEE
jgi:hypothetical protein